MSFCYSNSCSLSIGIWCLPIQLIIIKQKSYFIAGLVEDLCWNFIFLHLDFSSSIKEKHKVNLSPELGLAACQIQLITTRRKPAVNWAFRVIFKQTKNLQVSLMYLSLKSSSGFLCPESLSSWVILQGC